MRKGSKYLWTFSRAPWKSNSRPKVREPLFDRHPGIRQKNIRLFLHDKPFGERSGSACRRCDHFFLGLELIAHVGLVEATIMAPVIRQKEIPESLKHLAEI